MQSHRVNRKQPQRFRSTLAGFTVLELCFTIAILSSLLAIASPNISSWRKAVQRRAVAEDLAQQWNLARSLAGTERLEQRIVLDPNARTLTRYKGNRAQRSSSFTLSSGPSTLTGDAPIRTGDNCDSTSTITIDYTSRGAASLTASACVLNDDLQPVLQVAIESISIGRASVENF
jgi:Tfp pilus assembly protein FimT